MAAKKFDLIAVRIKDRREEDLGSARLIRMWDQERAEERIIDVSSRSARDRFSKLVRDREDELKGLLNRSGVDSIDIDTADDYTKPLSVFFRARAKRM